jgi:hypothetical protein
MSEPKPHRDLRAAVRAAAVVLRRDWDPIGGGSIPDLPADEYDSYAPQVVSLLEAGADDAAITAYLKRLEEETIMVSSGADLLNVAARLRFAVAAASSRTS